MDKAPDSNDHGLDYLITRSGFIGRQILKTARILYRLRARLEHPSGDAFWRIPVALCIARGLEGLTLFTFMYYVGGSLTRDDQKTLARLTGMEAGGAYRLTLFNALLFGIPSAAVYFLLGEGIQWMGDLHSLASIPSWVIGNASRLIGSVSLCIDLFRAADAALNRRCWAPFGTLPILINLPTYLKMFGRSMIRKKEASLAPTPKTLASSENRK